ncbi:MAG: hypothetical protein LBJ63_04875 [Prevotellaceae bacterium]|jgi:hypothetical protein|nr:hypothetical protein [Prevotellaceae bacterium]
MAKKYKVKSGYEKSDIITVPPLEKRDGGGRFDLSKCTQKDLRYLYEVIKCKYVEIDDEKQENTAGNAATE